MQYGKRLFAEAVGTFWLVFGGCGAAVFAAGVPQLGIGYAGVAFAFGLTVMSMAYAIGPVSGCHLNPAVSIGLAVAGRFPIKEVPLYVVGQLAGAVAAAAMLLHLAGSAPGFDLAVNGLAANGFDAGSPQGYGLRAVALAEMLATGFFVFIVIGTTNARAQAPLAPVCIGLALTLIHLVTIPISNTSVNPARSTGPALMAGGLAMDQLWLFWAAPVAGALVAGLVSRWLFQPET
ncbi:aquaporin [Cupriavidus taiwanensis]|uniref:Aquaporin n=1 Tax=Cupriavidus taiwanensis TaxID=164546 RepID=A0A375E809_9BURK|nr:aquaporin Z [Cupriavidus taiwanensis]SOZ64443.1 aquaporin [Cupriavidus taiwanensis]SOZ65148.1 aquaporin [Cupriavidus taiwanensis]SOZ68809.1 aquaporin [Cupriavidus taiwanensis]SPA08239.1 aquaporin [Cupriavidus taiwanensis]